MQIQTVTLTDVGPTIPVRIDLSRFRNGAGLLVTVSDGATATWSVQLSGDGVNWNDHDLLVTQTVSKNGNLAFPVLLIRLNGIVTDGTVTLVVIQAS